MLNITCIRSQRQAPKPTIQKMLTVPLVLFVIAFSTPGPKTHNSENVDNSFGLIWHCLLNRPAVRRFRTILC